MSAPKAEAAGPTVERRSELRRVAEAAGESNEGGWLVARGLREAVSRGGEVLERAEAAHIETFGPERVLALLDTLAAAEAERDEARVAVERVRALHRREPHEHESGRTETYCRECSHFGGRERRLVRAPCETLLALSPTTQCAEPDCDHDWCDDGHREGA